MKKMYWIRDDSIKINSISKHLNLEKNIKKDLQIDTQVVVYRSLSIFWGAFLNLWIWGIEMRIIDIYFMGNVGTACYNLVEQRNRIGSRPGPNNVPKKFTMIVFLWSRCRALFIMHSESLTIWNAVTDYADWKQDQLANLHQTIPRSSEFLLLSSLPWNTRRHHLSWRECLYAGPKILPVSQKKTFCFLLLRRLPAKHWDITVWLVRTANRLYSVDFQ